uniref:sensor histidine kinase n=1 Tax=Pararhizobium sp. IMCC3301 TaxID=3067904 RepID=UPI002740A250|nr:HAMP domain-containing sensor histidine kinase [Pararhizobium sp. IMCC3301]
MLTGALIGAGLSMPALLAVSRVTDMPTVPLLGMAIGSSVLGAFAGLLQSFAKSRGTEIPVASKRSGNAGSPTIRPLTELTLQHDSNGDIVSQSGSLHPLLQNLGHAVLGKGLLNRIRISDRPAFLKTVSDAAQGRPVLPVRLAVSLDQSPGVYHPFAFSAHWSKEGCISCLRDVPDTAAPDQEPANPVRKGGDENQLIVTLGYVAHEMRSPLNSILGFSELLTREAKTPRTAAQKQDYAGRINSAGQHLLGVVEKMLTAGQLEAGRLELSCDLFDAARLCRECISFLEPQVRDRSMKIVFDCPSDLPALYADQRYCRQMLLNILDNAVKFSTANQEIVLTLRKSDGHMDFIVRDAGKGIPDEALPRLARPFERVNGTCGTGTGLGLALVDQMASLHGGALKLESVLGEGTTVTISLPCVRVTPADINTTDDDNLFETSLLEPAGGFRRSA